MSYKVFIPTAGIGSRLGSLTKSINKSLVSVDNKPIISHIFNFFPDETEYVIALGYKGDLVKEYLDNVYPQKNIDFVFIKNFIGENSGLGHTLLSSAHLLQEPFIFISCDTLVSNNIPKPDHDWIAFANNSSIEDYRTVQIDSNFVKSFKEKGFGNKGIDYPYIGLCGINNYVAFWDGMQNAKINNEEIGEVSGLIKLLENGLKCYEMSWLDTGNIEGLKIAKNRYKTKNSPVILEKENEAIWFVNNKVVKFSTNRDFIKNRVLRAKEIYDYVPKIIKSSKHMYLYEREEGDVFSKSSNLPLFKKLLEESKIFWQKKKLDKNLKIEFQNKCLTFYRDKTLSRLKKFFKDFDKKDNKQIINGEKVSRMDDLIKKIDWNYLSDGLPARYHGDFHFENILWNNKKNKFIFLDWRQDFGGDLAYGDLYYDFAKLLHGLIVSHKIIEENQYSIHWDSNVIEFELKRFHRDVEFENYFNIWINENNYDLKKVRILTSLIYLNIAALHHKPYNYLLFALGKLMLQRQLSK